jgi:dihydroflavonol-4-reductase
MRGIFLAGVFKHLDFIVNLVDVRDVAGGLLRHERGQNGQRYILGGEDISLEKFLTTVAAITGRKALRVPIPALVAQLTAATMELLPTTLLIGHRPRQWRSGDRGGPRRLDRKIEA